MRSRLWAYLGQNYKHHPTSWYISCIRPIARYPVSVIPVEPFHLPADVSRRCVGFVRTKNYDALNGVLLAITGCEALLSVVLLQYFMKSADKRGSAKSASQTFSRAVSSADRASQSRAVQPSLYPYRLRVLYLPNAHPGVSREHCLQNGFDSALTQK